MQSTRLPKATVYRLLWTLEQDGLIQYEPKENKYRLGYKMLEYGGIVLENIDIRREAEPFLSELHNELGHMVMLAVRQQDSLQYLLRYDSEEGFQPLSFVGRRRMLHYGALGILLMAYMPEESARDIIKKNPLHPITPYTVTDEEIFFKRLRQIREQGFYIDVDEVFVGFTGVTIPVFGSRGEVDTVFGVIGNSFQFQGEYLEKVKRMALNTGLKISERLGYVKTT